MDEDEKELVESVGDGVEQPPKVEEEESPATEPQKESPDDEVEPDAAGGDVDGAGGDPGDAGVPAAEAGDGGVEPDAKGTEVPPVPADPAVAAPAKAEVAQPVEATPSPAAQRLAQIEQQILAEDFDGYTVEGRKLQIEHNRLAAHVAAEPLVANQFWTNESARHGLTGEKVKNIWDGITAQYAKDYPGTDPAYWQIAATKDYVAAVSAAKGTSKPNAAVAPPKPKVTAPTPITPKGARVAPPSAVVPPPPKARSDEEELVESVRREVKAGVRVA